MKILDLQDKTLQMDAIAMRLLRARDLIGVAAGLHRAAYAVDDLGEPSPEQNANLAFALAAAMGECTKAADASASAYRVCDEARMELTGCLAAVIGPEDSKS